MVAIGNSENDELFQIASIKVLIEFLYIKYKKSFLRFGLPSYIMQLVIFFLMIIINERQLEEAATPLCIKDELFSFEEEQWLNVTQAIEFCFN